MRSKLNFGILCGLSLCLILCQSCGEKWLEAKPDKSLNVATNIMDYQLLIDNSNFFNVNQSSGLGEMGAGDFFISSIAWQSLYNAQERSAYIWASTESFYSGEQSVDWIYGYQRILNANLILEGIEKVKRETEQQTDWNNLKGGALFFRAFDFFNLAQIYCVAYNITSASTDLGIPIRLQYDVNVNVKRGTLQQTYDRVIDDLLLAANLLSAKPKYKTRPSKEAAYALLARVYLAMENYQKAGYYADLALEIQSVLLDYKTLNNKSSFPFSRFNAEVIFQSVFSYGIFNASRLTVEPELYDAYLDGDCRKELFFTENAGRMTFKGSYNGDKNLFGGLATDELYLIRAEARARNGDLELALLDLNQLRRNRWKGSYQDLISNSPNVVLNQILRERRKELVFRGIRWTDLRRLNKDSRFLVTLTRVLNGVTYRLEPNDKKYVFPIDENEIRLNGIEQNVR